MFATRPRGRAEAANARHTADRGVNDSVGHWQVTPELAPDPTPGPSDEGFGLITGHRIGVTRQRMVDGPRQQVVERPPRPGKIDRPHARVGAVRRQQPARVVTGLRIEELLLSLRKPLGGLE